MAYGLIYSYILLGFLLRDDFCVEFIHTPASMLMSNGVERFIDGKKFYCEYHVVEGYLFINLKGFFISLRLSLDIV